MRRVLILLSLAAVLGIVWCYAQATADPVTRRASIAMTDWPANAPPIRVLIWSDVHLGNRATGAGRLARLIDRANALRPDLVILAGDYIAGHERADARVAPGLSAFGRLRAPLGVVAVLGNHEYWTDPVAVRRALEQAGVIVLANQSVRRGPVAVGGLDDLVNRRDDLPVTLAAIRRSDGAKLLVSHSPDIAPKLPRDVSLLVAGHTHCGQIVLPFYGPPVDVSRFGARYRCGIVREGARTTIVTAGTGTSMMPLRFGAPPDWWLLTLGP